MTSEQQALVTNNMKLAYKVAHKWKSQWLRHGMEFEDLTQTCLLGLCRAAHTYDPSRGVAFSTYATRVMDNEVFAELKKRRHYMDRNIATVDPELVDKLDLAGDDAERIEDAIIDRIVARQFLRHTFKKLPPYVKRLVAALLEHPNDSYNAISKKLKHSHAWAHNTLKRLQQDIARGRYGKLL